MGIKNVIEFFPELIFNENVFYYSSIKGIGKKEIKKILTALFY